MQGNNAVKRNKRLYLIVGVLFVAVLLTVGGLYAKYIYQKDALGSATSPEFYFESDKLTVGGTAHTVNAGTSSLSIQLKNYADALRFSDDDIAYTVTVMPSVGITVTNGSGTLNGDACNDIWVTLSGLENGKSYTVEAVGTAGFKQKLTATITVKDADEVLYKNINAPTDSAFVLLTVWTGNLQGDVTIAYPDGLIPDNTDPLMATLITGPSTFSLPYEKNSSHVFRFFKDTDYDAAQLSSISVKMNGTEATESAIP